MWGFSLVLKLKLKHFFKWKSKASTLFFICQNYFHSTDLVHSNQICVWHCSVYISQQKELWSYFLPSSSYNSSLICREMSTGVRASSWCYGCWKPFRYAKVAQNPPAYTRRTKRTCISLQVCLSCIPPPPAAGTYSSPLPGVANIRGDITHLRQVLQRKTRNMVWAVICFWSVFATWQSGKDFNGEQKQGGKR